MTKNTKIFLIYGAVALLSVAMIVLFRGLGAAVPEQEVPDFSQAGKETAERFFKIEQDLEMIHQGGEKVKLSDIIGKVTVVAQFFAVCPHCALRSGIELQELHQRFGGDPDFKIVCITVDPETDGPEELAAYSEALGADVKNWWFATASDKEKTHRYLEEALGFMGIRERTNPIDISENGRYSHDLGLLLVDREFNVIGKWPLADARSEEGREVDPTRYERLKKGMYERIEQELEKR